MHWKGSVRHPFAQLYFGPWEGWSWLREGVGAAKAYVDGKLVTQAELTFAIGEA